MSEYTIVINADTLPYEIWARDYDRVWDMAEKVGAVLWIHDEWTDGPQPFMDSEKAVVHMGSKKSGIDLDLIPIMERLHQIMAVRGWYGRPRTWRTRCECARCECARHESGQSDA